MDFKKLMNVASQNERNAQKVRCGVAFIRMKRYGI